METLIAGYDVRLNSADPGGAELCYFGASLPAPPEARRMTFYRYLAVIANRWNEALGIDIRYPMKLVDFLRRNGQIGQVQGQSHLNRIGVEGYVPLH